MQQFTSLAFATLVINWTLTFMAFLAILAISWDMKLSGSVRTDDVIVIMAFLISTVLVSLSTWAIVDEGVGKHQKDVSASHLEIAAKSVLISEALWTLVTGLLRIAASLLLYNIFKIKSWAKHTIIGIVILSAALALASIIQIFLICQPFAAQWDPHVLGSCGDQVTSFLIIESMGLLLDIGILTVPSIAILHVQMPVRSKVAGVLILNVGALVLIVTGLRMAALRNAISPDFTYSQSYLSLLSSAGCMTGVICCASLAIKRIAMWLFEDMDRRRKRKTDLEANVPSPPVMDTGNMRFQPGREERGNDHGSEKGSRSGTETDGTEEGPVHEAVTHRVCSFPQPAGAGEVNNFERRRGRCATV